MQRRLASRCAEGVEVFGAEEARWVSVEVVGAQLGVDISARLVVEPDSEGGSAQDEEDEEISLNLSTGSATIRHKSSIHSRTLQQECHSFSLRATSLNFWVIEGQIITEYPF